MRATPWWTQADSAEMDALVWELCRSYVKHRDRCDACSPEPCPMLTGWREHVETCKACKGEAPLTYGLPASGITSSSRTARAAGAVTPALHSALRSRS